MTHQYDLCLKICKEVHAGKVRKYTGEPYHEHPIRVAANSPAHLQCAALLHDVFEDFHLTADKVIEMGVSPISVDMAYGMKKNKTEGYHEYILRLKESPSLRRIKVEDLLDNLDNLPPSHQRDKYLMALAIFGYVV